MTNHHIDEIFPFLLITIHVRFRQYFLRYFEQFRCEWTEIGEIDHFLPIEKAIFAKYEINQILCPLFTYSRMGVKCENVEST